MAVNVTPEMLARGRENGRVANLITVEFREELTAFLPLPDG